MLQQILHITILSTLCIIWGIPVWLFLYSSVKKDHFWYHSTISLLCFLFFCGCFFISVLSSWIYLLVPLHFFYLLLLTVALVIFLFLFQKKRIIKFFQESSQPHIKLSFMPLLFIIINVLLFILLSSLQPVNGDTQIYHMQIIRWQTEYKVVPGVVNLYPRFGLGSNWFNLISFFYWPIFKNENFTYLNAGFVIWFFIWLSSKWHFYFKKPDANSGHGFLSAFYFLIILYCIFDWQLFRDSANSTNYDFAVNAFTIIIISYFIEGVFIKRPRNQFSFIILSFVLCTVSFKLSGIFLLFLVLYHTLISWKTVKWVVAIFFGLAIILPVLAKNFIATGYPLFPSTFTINSPDWIFPEEMANGFYKYIILSNRFYNYQWSFINQVDHTSFNWIPYWFHGILWKHKIILVTALSSIFFLFKKTNLDIDHRQLRLIIACLLLMLTGWFFTAPDPGRFGYGILLSASFLSISLFIYPLMKKLYVFILLATTVVIATYIFKKSKPVINNLSYITYPSAFREPSYEIIRSDDINFKLPYKIDNNWDCRCYFTPLPCITQKNPYLQARGQNLSDGFRMEPHPDSSFINSYVY